MIVSRKDFPEVMPDNDMFYMSHLEAVIASVDELCHLQVTRKPSSYHFRIAPSVPSYIEPLLEEIFKLNNIYGIRLDMSKSIKASSVITFEIQT